MNRQLPNGPIDTHCHLADPRIFSNSEELIRTQAKRGVLGFILGGVDPGDWARQLELALKFPDQIFCTFGLHPYFVSDHSNLECDQALEVLQKNLSKAVALGETGLDFRPHILKDRKAAQAHYFELQLDLAASLDKAVVLHIVKAHPEALALLSRRPGLRGLVHSFNSGVDVARSYLDLGFYLSVGGPLHAQNQTLCQAIRWAPLDRLLIESDSPDQPPPQLKGKLNEPWTIHLVAEQISELKGIKTSEVFDQCRSNLLRLFSQEFVG